MPNPQPQKNNTTLLEIIRERIDADPSEFVQPKFLCEIGLFGSMSAALNTVTRGAIPSIRVSPHRILIAKQDIYIFAKERLNETKVTV